MKLSKKQKDKLHRQYVESHPADRGPTWVGIRPSVCLSKKYNKKAGRAENKALCKAYC